MDSIIQSLDCPEGIEMKELLTEIEEHKVKIVYVKLYDTFMVWIGDPLNVTLDNMTVALCGSTTTILDKNLDLFDNQMALKLSKKFNDNRPVYVAYNYQPVNSNVDLKLALDKKIIQFVEQCKA